MNITVTIEKQFESDIEAFLISAEGGYTKGDGTYNPIAKQEQYLSEMENYKKSLIYEYVTGKKEVIESNKN